MILLKNKQFYYWNKKTVSPWINFDKQMNYKFSYINKILFKNISIQKDHSILDIGCGSGFTSFRISKKVGVNGIVKGVDISKPLLSLFKKKYNNIKNISCIRKDLQKTYFNNNIFDHAISRFGVMFFEYPLLAFKHIHQSLKNEGTLTFVCWTNFRYNQFFFIPAYIISKKINVKIPRFQNKPEPFAFKDRSYLQNILKQSGFKKVTIKNLKTKLKICNIKTEIEMMMSLGIGAQILRENSVNKNTYNMIKYDIGIRLKKLIQTQNYYKANIYLVNACK